MLVEIQVHVDGSGTEAKHFQNLSNKDWTLQRAYAQFITKKKMTNRAIHLIQENHITEKWEWISSD